MKNENKIYVNFPICLLEEIDIKIVIKNALDYGCFAHSKRLNLGTDKYIDSMNYFKFTKINPEIVLDSKANGQRIFELYKHSTHTGVNVDILWNYHKNEKSNSDIITLRAFCATKAMIGNKNYQKTNKEQIVSKMFGFTDINQITEKGYLKYLTRYQFAKLMYELEKKWYLKYVSNHSRGCFISYKLNLVDLMFEEEKLKLNSKIGTVNPIKQNARIQAKKKLREYLENAEC